MEQFLFVKNVIKVVKIDNYEQFFKEVDKVIEEIEQLILEIENRDI